MLLFSLAVRGLGPQVFAHAYHDLPGRLRHPVARGIAGATIWNVCFGPLRLGRLNERHMRIEDDYGRLYRRHL